jgi:hypothetical protein
MGWRLCFDIKRVSELGRDGARDGRMDGWMMAYLDDTMRIDTE